MMPGDEERQRAAGHRDRHHLRIAERGVQGGNGRQRWRLRRLAGPHHPGHGQQDGIQEAGLEFPHPAGGARERQAWLHNRALGKWRQEMGMEGIDAKAQRQARGLAPERAEGRNHRGGEAQYPGATQLPSTASIHSR
jgi:hypothetical protein